MNFFEARKILELESTYTVDDIKKNYRRLAMTWHPDKNPDPESTDRFAKINTAYQFLLKEETGGTTEQPTIFDQFKFSDLLKTFTTVSKTFKPMFYSTGNKEITVDLTLSEYFLGCTKEIEVKEPCRCEKVICTTCAGCGYSIHGFVALQRQLDQCETCMGEGIRNVCGLCKLGYIGVKKTIGIPPRSRLDFTVENVRIKINLVGGKYQDGKIMVPFDISLKASLTGFRRKFKDPFGDIHFVQVKKIVKPNDGYLIKMQYCTELLLVFNIIYPESLSQDSIDKIRLIDF